MKWIYASLSDFDEKQAQSVHEKLSNSRREHIESFKKEDDRKRSLLGEKLLRDLLKTEYCIEDMPIECDEKGRPFINRKGIFLSVSHSNNLVACAVDDSPIGIDVELISPIKSRLIEWVCNENEKGYVLGENSYFNEISDKDVLKRFFIIWTAKEAYLKMMGTGITNFHSVDVLKEKRIVEQINDYIVTIIKKR